MTTDIDQGIRISVETMYQESYSNPQNNLYLFSYKISINNTNEFPVQLVKRSWFIKDSMAENRKIEGDGVVGLRPIIRPGGTHEYESSCNLHTDYGSMSGAYFFINLNSEEHFKARIPEFKLVIPYKFN
ncbi:MAG: Co2+/Mg2+ efflux protein ApaG [Crocinitomicaceae bacterium]|nr:Co2+/Mg2+ efflux protein ApaG [Crocinitomicaceae bacterium]MBT6029946.1 Co2+/Mg2+ efflux protein ApaG [Crocinitomicaceae bacterium]MDG2332356.1 Co2+/Mg2+ efflux protein ApaG [Flavobacteriales bacterium]